MVNGFQRLLRIHLSTQIHHSRKKISCNNFDQNYDFGGV